MAVGAIYLVFMEYRRLRPWPPRKQKIFTCPPSSSGSDDALGWLLGAMVDEKKIFEWSKSSASLRCRR